MTVPAFPSFQAAGTSTSGTGNLSPAWPTHQTDDIAILVVDSQNEANALGTANGFVEMTNSPQNSTGAVLKARLSIFWCRATSNAMSAPVITATTLVRYARIYTFRNVLRTGNPFEVSAGGTNGSGTAVTILGATTKKQQSLVVAVCAYADLTTTPQSGSFTNANLASITTRGDESVIGGCGAALATGTWAAGGAYGSTTMTLSNSSDFAVMSFALSPRWTVDASSGVSFPANTTEWTDFIADCSLTTNGLTAMSAPNGLNLAQEASGNLADSIGSFTMAATNLSYQNAMTGFTRLGVATVNGATSDYQSTSASLPDLSLTTQANSLAVFFPAYITAIPGANRDILEAAGAALRIRITSSSRAVVVSGANTATGTKDPINGSGLAGGGACGMLLVLNRTASTLKLYTSQEIITCTIASMSSSKSLVLGGTSSGNVAVSTIYGYDCFWIGAPAEFTPDGAYALLAAMAYAPLWHAYAAELSETNSLSESLATVYNAIQGISETDSLAEALATVYNAISSLSESNSLAESLAALYAANPGLSESNSLSEALAVLYAATQGLSETNSLSESLAIVYAAIQGISESSSLAEALTVVYSAIQALSETDSLVEALAVVYSAIQALSETDNLVESLAAVYSAIQALSETDSLSESLASQLSVFVGLSESNSLTEQLASLYNAVSSLSESNALAESLSIVYSALAGLNETSNLTESLLILAGFFAALAESDNLAELVEAIYHSGGGGGGDTITFLAKIAGLIGYGDMFSELVAQDTTSELQVYGDKTSELKTL